MGMKNPELIIDPRAIAGIGRFPGVDTELYSSGSARNRLSQEEKTFLYQALSMLSFRALGFEIALFMLARILECSRTVGGYRMFDEVDVTTAGITLCPFSSGERVRVGNWKWCEDDSRWTFRLSAAFHG